MTTPQIPDNELERQAALENYDVLSAFSEEEYDNITQIAARIMDVPICVISLVDNERQFFKSKQGIDVQETGRDISFCGHAINYNDIFVVEDALKDERFYDNPLVTGGPEIRFYAGAQLKTENGFNIGTLCAIDSKPRLLSDNDKKLLNVLSKNVMSMFELRLKNKNLNIQIKESLEKNEELSQLLTDKENLILNSLLAQKQETQSNLDIPFDLSSSINIIKNSIYNDLKINNNNILFFSTKMFVEGNKNYMEIIIKNILLCMNDFLKNETFSIKATEIGDKCVINFKNSYLQSWNNTLSKDNSAKIIEIESNIYFEKAMKFSSLSKANLNLENVLQKGLNFEFVF